MASGLLVAQMTRFTPSRAPGKRSDRFCVARMPSTLLLSSGAACRRSRMPVREVIQSSVVSSRAA